MNHVHPQSTDSQQRTTREYGNGNTRGAARTTIGRPSEPYDGHVCVAHYPAGHHADRLIIAQYVSAVLGLFPSRGTDSP